MTTQPAPPVTTGHSSWRRLWWVLVVAWGLVLTAVALASARTDPPTVREQRSIAQAQPIVDRALAEVARAAGPVAVVEVLGYELRPDCQIHSARDGLELDRVVLLHTAPGGEAAVLDRVAAQLPRGWEPVVRRQASGNVTLRADAGEFVGVHGGVVGPGQLRVTAGTGCRPAAPLTTAGAPAPDRAVATVDAVLSTLGGRAAQRRTESVVCPGGGAVTTVAADSAPGLAPGPLPQALRGVAPAGPVVAEPALLAYRDGDLGVVVRERDGVVTVSATRGCG
ncbi:MAG TPA: hypothetical protein VFM55_03910 [Micromonosporaceae bacterium]|nr:hypothetical protein [Micromonosporaceae bacterium]